MELDRSRATPVVGNSRARWFQDGRYFAGDGTPLTAEEAIAPADVEPPPPPPSDDVPRYHVVEAVVNGKIGRIDGFTFPEGSHSVTTQQPAELRLKERIHEMAARDEERRIALNALRNAELWAAVEAAGGTPARGPHHRARNIRWLLENTR